MIKFNIVMHLLFSSAGSLNMFQATPLAKYKARINIDVFDGDIEVFEVNSPNLRSGDNLRKIALNVQESDKITSEFSLHS